MKGPILVASDGSRGAFGAVRLAKELAARDDLEVQVVTVVLPLAGYDSVDEKGEAHRVRATELVSRRVAEQLSRLTGEPARWPIETVVGVPAPIIARIAADRGAGLVLLGRGAHTRVDRWFGTETALQVIHLSAVPVLAVPDQAAALPRRAVVGIDFSEFCHDAARTAAELLDAGGALRLVHVVAASAEEMEVEEVYRSAAAEAEEGLDRLGRELADGYGLEVEVRVEHGNPARVLAEHAQSFAADMVAVGSHGAGFWSRLLMGSVATHVLRGVDRLVLVTPPRQLPPEVRTSFPVDEWPARAGKPTAPVEAASGGTIGGDST